MKQTEFLDGKIKLWMDEQHRYWIQEDINLDLEILAEINQYRRHIFNPVGDVISIGNLEITDRPPLQVPALTAALGMINKSGALMQWSANLAADHFRDNLNNHSRLTPNDIARLHREARFAHKAKSKEATDVGTEVHNYAEKYAKACIEGLSMPAIPMADESVLNGIGAFLEWVEQHKVRFIKTEFMLFSWDFMLAGTCDALLEVDGEIVIADYKTSKAVYNEYFYQIAFYRFAFQILYHEVDKMAVIRFDKESGNFEYVTVPEESYPRCLLAVKGARDIFYAVNGY